MPVGMRPYTYEPLVLIVSPARKPRKKGET